MGWLEKYSKYGIFAIIIILIIIAIYIILFGHFCGDDSCDWWETAENCPEDCLINTSKCRNESYPCTVENIPCCEGLVEVPSAFPSETGCIAASCGNICRPCGDGICQENENNCSCPEDCMAACHQNITIANWNLQVFGDTKASNSTLMQIYSSIIDDYDIVFVQEIRDADGSAFSRLCSMLPNYNCQNSSRAGRSTSKEQYGVIYKNGINIIEWADFNPDSQDRWERPPLKVTFNTSCYRITIYNIHTKPEDVKRELAYLENATVNQGNAAVLGDLNADCSYYSAATEPEFDTWHWIIPDNADTTVSPTDCAYDRIILNDDSYSEYSTYGIYREGIVSGVSDHYLVWVKLET